MTSMPSCLSDLLALGPFRLEVDITTVCVNDFTSNAFENQTGKCRTGVQAPQKSGGKPDQPGITRDPSWRKRHVHIRTTQSSYSKQKAS